MACRCCCFSLRWCMQTKYSGWQNENALDANTSPTLRWYNKTYSSSKMTLFTSLKTFYTLCPRLSLIWIILKINFKVVSRIEITSVYCHLVGNSLRTLKTTTPLCICKEHDAINMRFIPRRLTEREFSINRVNPPAFFLCFTCDFLPSSLMCLTIQGRNILDAKVFLIS